MRKFEPPLIIVMAEDDPDDCLLVKEALAETQCNHTLLFVKDGQELMDYLKRQGRFVNPIDAPRPNLILLDLNMPRKKGWEVIEEIKANADLRRIPIVVLTTSEAEADIERTYEMGANSFITKPVSFESLVDSMRTLGKYWFKVVKLPAERVDN